MNEEIIDENDTFKLVLLTNQYAKDAIDILAIAFSEKDPLSPGRWRPDQARPFVEYSIVELGIPEKISFVAIDKNNHRVVHALVNFDYVSPFQFDWSQMPMGERGKAIGSLIRSLGENFKKENVKPGEVLHMWMAGTIDGYEGRGLFYWSSKNLMKVAKKRGYKKIVVEATSAATHHVLVNKLGFKVNNTIIPSERYPEVLKDLGNKKVTYLIADL